MTSSIVSSLANRFLGDAVRRTIGLFELCVGLGMPCDLFAQRRNPLAGNAAEPKKRPE